MEYKTLIKKLKINWLKVATLAIFDQAGLYEYALDKANSAVNLLMSANADKVQEVRERLFALTTKCRKYVNYVPVAWERYADYCNALLLELYNATADGKIDGDERQQIAEKFRSAYAVYKAD